MKRKKRHENSKKLPKNCQALLGEETRDALMLLSVIRFVVVAIVVGCRRRYFFLLLPLAILHLLSISRTFVFGSFGLRRLDRHALVESKAADVSLVICLQAAFPPQHLGAARG